jgi:hypothetical protein
LEALERGRGEVDGCEGLREGGQGESLAEGRRRGLWDSIIKSHIADTKSNTAVDNMRMSILSIHITRCVSEILILKTEVFGLTYERTAGI